MASSSTSRARTGSRRAISAASDGAATDPAIKVVVLIDGNSASASEIVAGALQARGRAQLIGSQSFGKGTIQAFQQLSDNGGGFRLTIAKWLTPDKVWINHVGLTPNVACRSRPIRRPAPTRSSPGPSRCWPPGAAPMRARGPAPAGELRPRRHRPCLHLRRHRASLGRLILAFLSRRLGARGLRAIALVAPFGYGFRVRKEVMCSV